MGWAYVSEYLTTISVELRVSTEFEVLKFKTCSLYHKTLVLQKFNDMITQVLKKLFWPVSVL